ncbi:site-specific DNA-methyltransferase [Mycoplasmopsis cynos]|uniref:site-specific DNA-methyltransferase n=1 Tax=Mycoplasmopsis cynos TaxID=171284 RepID=UPI002AFFECB4|nr:DNA methyltransferase [Mycoplasmopsis cynos]WQQ17622.1 DNA methyltransferase [Mycoplasmopsis cynos]
MELLEKFKGLIDEISSKELNQDQKDLAIRILEKFEDKDLEYVFQFIAQRIKTGFRFDSAPESNSQTIALLEKENNLSFVLDENKTKENALIIGENYDALKNLLLIERERERERAGAPVKYDLIYIDPPYNTEATKNDGNSIANDKENVQATKFVYRDKYSRNGWLNLMNERLKLAKELLKDDGVIFVSIDDAEQAYLKVLMDEIFGEENFITNFVWISNKKGRQIAGDKAVSETFEYILMYRKSEEFYQDFNIDWEYATKLMPSIYEKKDLEIKEDKFGKYIIQNELYNTNIKAFNEKTRPNLYFPIFTNGKEITTIYKENYSTIYPPKNKYGVNGVWRWGKEKINNESYNLEVLEIKGQFKIYTKVRKFSYKLKNIFLSEKISTRSGNVLLDSILNYADFNTAKPISLINLILKVLNKPNARILDFFAGSGTTAHAVLDLNKEDGGNRTFTLVTNIENNIGIDVNYERLYRINHGIGTKGESFEWANKNEPYKSNLNVYNIKYYDISLFNNIDVKEIVKELIKLLKDFGVNSLSEESEKDYTNLLNSLLSLKPQLKENNESN